MAKIRIDCYLHSSKDEMAGIGEENGLSEEALNKFVYALYEVKLPLMVDTETGEYELIKEEIED